MWKILRGSSKLERRNICTMSMRHECVNIDSFFASNFVLFFISFRKWYQNYEIRKLKVIQNGKERAKL